MSLTDRERAEIARRREAVMTRRAELTQDEINEIAQRVFEARKLTGMSQGQLAEVAGVGVSSVCRVELGTGAPSRRILERIAAALEVEPHDLFADLFRLKGGDKK